MLTSLLCLLTACGGDSSQRNRWASEQVVSKQIPRRGRGKGPGLVVNRPGLATGMGMCGMEFVSSTKILSLPSVLGLQYNFLLGYLVHILSSLLTEMLPFLFIYG